MSIMHGSIRALAAILFVYAVPAGAQPAPPRVVFAPADLPVPPPDGAGVFEVVKRFDFNERELGNFEDLPMYWRRLAGEGLPRYSNAEFDDGYGHAAPPSFVFHLRGGNIAYEYHHDDITVQPGADYLLVGYIRAVGLEYARAFVQAYFVDRFGDPIPGSDHVSELVRSLHAAPSRGGTPLAATSDEPWQRVELTLRGTHEQAHALRLRFWVLQTHVWLPPPPDEIDPIIRQDVQATVWFDDFTLYCLPHVGLRISAPGGLVVRGGDSAAVLDVRSAAPEPLPITLRVLDAGGEEHLAERYEVSGQAPPLECPLPPLEPGLYSLEAWLGDGEGAFCYRRMPFAVAAPLPQAAGYPPDFGVDIGPWRAGDVPELLALVRELRCGALKVGLPMFDAAEADVRTAYLDDLRDFAERAAADGVRLTGVLLPPGAAVRDGLTTARVLLGGVYGPRPYGPVLAHLGGLIPGLQLGDEQVELAAGSAWGPNDLLSLRRELRRYVTAPELVLPCSVFDARLEAGEGEASAGPARPGRYPEYPDALSIRVPAEVPAHAFARQLGFLAQPAGGRLLPPTARADNRWLLIEPPDGGLPAAERAADLMRRVVLAKALSPGPVYLPAPFRLTTAGGQAQWSPTDDYLILRTLFHHLGGKQPAAVMPLPDLDGVAIFFEGESDSCVVLWTWRAQAVADPLELYLGPAPQLVDRWGRQTPCPVVAGRALVSLRPTPTIITGVDTPLALLQASFSVESAFLEVHEPEPPPVLRLRNAYDAELTGTITLNLPELWQATPDVIPLALAPGEALAQPLLLTLPPHELAGRRPIGVRVELTAPVSEVLEFEVPLTVGLRGLEVEAAAHWEGDTLVVEQMLRNATDMAVSFEAFCRAPGYPQADRVFLDVAPGERRRQEYRFGAARRLAGSWVRLGLREIHGPRSLDQLVEIPP